MRAIACLICFLMPLTGFAQLPAVSAGRIERIENFRSKFVTSRHVDVWLPEEYPAAGKYDVLYMHDGQMLYDSSTTWNKASWDVDNVITKLLRERKIRNVIVVGIWNGGATRHTDYFPQEPFESLSRAEHDTVVNQLQRSGRTKTVFHPKSDNYLKFLVKELKPYIDRNFAVHTGREHTFIAGSSMGGLISLYAICEYPRVFGGAACMSTHWPGTFTVENNPVPQAFFNYMNKSLPDPSTHSLYFDFGDQTLDALYPPLQARADEVMRTRGYTETNWMTNAFPGTDHSEQAWRKRLDVPLIFLLGNGQ